MVDEATQTNNSGAEAGADAAATQNAPLAERAAKMYGNDSEGGDNASKEEAGDKANDAADTSNTNDEADKADADPDKEKKDAEGEESEDGEEKKVDYGDVKLPEDLPEGMSVDTELFDGVKEIAAKHNIPAEAVQEMVDAYAKRVAESDTNLQKQWAEVEKGWKDTAKNDPEIGGDKFDSSVEKAKRAISTFGTPELKEALEQSRMGNNPEVIRFMTRIGEKITEDGGFDRGSSSGQRSRSDILFDKT